MRLTGQFEMRFAGQKNANTHLTEVDLLHLASLLSGWMPPKNLTKFVAGYLEGRAITSIFDENIDDPSFICEFAKRPPCPQVSSTGYDLSKQIASRLLPAEFTIHWRDESEMDDKFDLVFSQRTTKLPQETKHSRLLDAVKYMSDRGQLISIVPGNYFENSNTLKILEKLNLQPEIALAISNHPTGESRLFTTHLLMIFGRSENKQLFVAELPQDESILEQVIKNAKAKKRGRFPELGMVVDYRQFRSFRSALAQFEMEREGRSQGYEPRKLADLLRDVNRGRQEEGKGFHELPNCVYLPLIGTSNAVTSLDALKLKQHNYVQLVVNEAECNPNYLAAYLNAPIGRKLRDALLSGLYIPKISLKTLENADVYVPPLEVQGELKALDLQIHEVASNLEFMRRQLWSQPRSLKQIQKEFSRFQSHDELLTWIESLPFPIGSIVWSYEAAATPKDKVEALLHFFEALSMFLSTIFLSVQVRDESLLRSEVDYKDAPTRADRPNWQHPGFGNWVNLAERLAKSVRRALSSSDTRIRVLDLFGKADEEVIDMILDKRLYTILKQMSKYRNDWKGHGGIIGQEQAKQALVYLEENLAEIKMILSSNFQRWILIRPGLCELTDNVFKTSAQLIVGRTATFKTKQIDTLIPLNTRRLYLYVPEQPKPFELLPVFQLMESPKTQHNACYFFNRVDGDKVRWVSYHYDKEAECYASTDQSVRQILNLLEA